MDDSPSTQSQTITPRTAGRPLGSKDKHRRIVRTAQERITFAQAYQAAQARYGARIVRKAFQMAMKGDSRMLVDALNRLMGMPRQSLEVSGPGGQPIRVQAMAGVVLAQLDEGELRGLEALNARLAQAVEPQPALLPAQSGPVEPQPEPEPSITTQPSITTPDLVISGS